MSYIKSLRFKLMLLCVIPLVSIGFAFIAHSVVIANQVKENAAATYEEVLIEAGADEQILRAQRSVDMSLGWLGKQWVIFYMICFVFCYIPITINIGRIIKPIRAASGYSDSLARGKVDIEVIKNRTDEIGILQESFGNLVSASRKQAALIKRIAEGDLTENYTPLSKEDDVGQSLVQMLERNNTAMMQIAVASGQLLTATNQIADSSQSLASGASEQSAAVEELSASIHEVSQTAHKNAELASKAAALGESIMNSAQKGSGQMTQLVAAVKEINDASIGIHKVIKAIEDIAFQTNILALNASVEAARAGQHGKGFAVVAEEVRNLANKSATAAKDSGMLITNSIEKAELGSRIADDTAISLSEIVTGISESGEIIKEIAESNRSLDTSIDQINRGVEQVSQVVAQNNAAAEQTAAASEEMNSQSEMLQTMVGQFKLNKTYRESIQNAGLPTQFGTEGKRSAARIPEASSAYGKY